MRMAISKATAEETQAMIDDHEREKRAEAEIERQRNVVYLLREPYATRWVDVPKTEYAEAMRSVGIVDAEPRDFKRRGLAGRVETEPK